MEYFAYNTQIAGCSDTIFLSDTAGYIGDGSGSFSYLNGLECYWHINPPGNKPINFSFSSFNTETSYDYLYAYDGNDTMANLIGAFNGINIPAGLFTEISGSLFLYFKTDHKSQYEVIKHLLSSLRMTI